MSKGQRLIKKIIILTIFISSLLLLDRLLFPPVLEICFNGQLDFGEEKLDCGGICEKKCPPPLMPPEASDINVEWVKYVKDGQNNYDLVARISNNNISWGLSSLGYRFKIYNDNNEIIKTEDRETYIMPVGFIKNETGKYIIYDNYKYEENIKKVDIQLYDYNWSEIKDKRELPDYNVEIIQINNTYGKLVENGPEYYFVYGETKNTSRYNFYKVDIAVIIYNDEDDVIAIGRTEQATMGAGNGWEFRIFWRQEFTDEIAHIDYQAQTNIFSEFNFIKAYGTGEKYLVPK